MVANFDFKNVNTGQTSWSSAPRVTQVSVDINSYYETEKKLRVLLRERQERLDGIFNRLSLKNMNKQRLGEGEFSVPNPEEANSEKQPYNVFLDVYDATEDTDLPELVMARREIVFGASEMEAHHLSSLDAAIAKSREHLRELEDNIMTYEPSTARDSMMKLRFITAMLLNGSEVEMDYLAYLLEECIDGMQATLGASLGLSVNDSETIARSES